MTEKDLQDRSSAVTAAVRGLAALLFALAISGCGSSPTHREPALGVSASVYDDFSTGEISATKWTEGERQAVLQNQSAVLSSEITDARPNGAYGSEMVMIPPEAGVVTTFRTEIQIASANLTGDVTDRSGIELLFQPAANRIGNDLTNALMVRIILSSAGGGLAQRQLFECTSPDCSSFAAVGTIVHSDWPREGLPIAMDTRYRITISIDTAAKVFRFWIFGGAFNFPKHTTFDASAGAPPFPVDLSPDNFARARLWSQVRSGPAGGGNGQVSTSFTNVEVGMNGQPAALFDDFSTGPDFDPGKWTVSKQSVLIVDSALEFSLSKEGSGTTLPMQLADPTVDLLRANVTIKQWSLAGHGIVSALIQGSMYNDGSGDPNDNRPGSSLGDIIATVNMARSRVWYDLIRCDSVGCSSFTAIQSGRALGNVTLGTTHTLVIQWNRVQQQVLFQLDDHEVVTVDPVGAGYSVASEPNRPFRRIGVRAVPVPAGAPFSGSIVADFDDVRAQ